MLKQVLLIIIVLGIAIVGGAASVWYMLQAEHGVGAMTAGPWKAYPDIGTPDADPYSKARIAREGVLTLGRAEGIAFIADQDSSGHPLLEDCNYLVEGSAPAARFWTLSASIGKSRGNDGAPAVQSRSILRQSDNSFVVGFGHRPVPGNWVKLWGTGRMQLLLVLYDTAIEGNTGLVDLTFPQILRTSCDD